jgi:hypothetical protein
MPSPFSERRAIFPQEKRKPRVGCIGLASSTQKERGPRNLEEVRDAEVDAAIHVLQAKSGNRDIFHTRLWANRCLARKPNCVW